MKRLTTGAASTIALVIATQSVAQNQEVQLLSDWRYDALYTAGWSVDNMFDRTEIIDANGDEIGDIENIIFSNDGHVLGIIAQVGGFWDIGDTHVHIPWDVVTLQDGIAQMIIPVTQDTIDEYDVFGDGWFDDQVISAADTAVTQAVNDDLVAGAGIFKATDLIGDYVYLSDGARYGYVADIIVQDGAISAMVTDAGASGRSGFYAYPYAYRADMYGPRYELPYETNDVDTIEAFDYTQLQSRVTD
ncbi:PRC-barrel domain-containing protein [Yoonia vestfoldensis]|uniref:PRC-barrel domain protein n=1 Tax=Yoonia vestfoldensis TaxID=245188 RepID=A0A1Y0EAV8_9RHOB|nr:PRC-barrel domain-containing protein [Yoonia vestfoldensis]ARU00693.1 PRC-barrel domain protein [Yoonia vestfoldensis]